MTRFALLFASALALSACGGDICDRSAKDAEDCGQTVSDAQLEACKTSLESCSADEEKQIEDMYDCFEDKGFNECPSTGTTTTGTTDLEQMLADLAECSAKASGVSAECAAAVGGGGGTTTTATTTTTTTSGS